MFDKAKQIMQMRQQAKKLQDELEQIVDSYAKGDIKVKVNAAQKVVYLEVDGQERSDIVNAINEAMKQVQKKAAKKMMEMGGGLSGLSKMLGGS